MALPVRGMDGSFIFHIGPRTLRCLTIKNIFVFGNIQLDLAPFFAYSPTGIFGPSLRESFACKSYKTSVNHNFINFARPCYKNPHLSSECHDEVDGYCILVVSASSALKVNCREVLSLSINYAHTTDSRKCTVCRSGHFT